MGYKIQNMGPVEVWDGSWESLSSSPLSCPSVLTGCQTNFPAADISDLVLGSHIHRCPCLPDLVWPASLSPVALPPGTTLFPNSAPSV